MPPMLTVVGSVNEVSQRQAAYAVAHGFTGFPVSPELLLAQHDCQSPPADDLVFHVADCLAAKRPVVLQTSRNAADVREVIETGARLELNEEKLHERITGNLARIVKRILDRTSVPTLTVFGGDTLLAIARECGWRGFYPHDELAPGVVHAETEPGGKTHIISKPGGFGGEDALWEIWKAIAAADRIGVESEQRVSCSEKS